ncbi:HAMP domain-containing protein, partial [Intestinimonas massiliensis]|uniref:histidine kinase dimerization/phospho-acceptor domain-containing protein n=1 Tax=Intestinimonas massiliensis (ex Afouda et al. 2020) TaxID=1673721 RepID=UPI00210BC964
GEFDVRVSGSCERCDEVGELATAFNAMADSLAKSEARRSEFLANISHELKTPMTTIAGFAVGILDGTVPPEKQEAALKTISSETRRLSRLVRRMLDLSRLQ